MGLFLRTDETKEVQCEWQRRWMLLVPLRLDSCPQCCTECGQFVVVSEVGVQIELRLLVAVSISARAPAVRHFPGIPCLSRTLPRS